MARFKKDIDDKDDDAVVETKSNPIEKVTEPLNKKKPKFGWKTQGPVGSSAV